ncbi:hybrid sensor histidine kinase/response regulator [Teichococcus cervicalis]|uniref:histidine kinase n=1 Tax=Pseudoroseomonas cervicalis ATCC 49957 TaxID=525371 RepID=D5RMV0_9PROT|nr:hybrid sensor histidine kinase/response regulator [Pseudoroseomonas cervicalis]EFH11363.1 ATPase/histidine kinase/DNA gyrase B/HSP90 domain protein [Pseudoroseomonas cervicalis ATCC 49957]
MTGLSRRTLWLLALLLWAFCSLGAGYAGLRHIRHVEAEAKAGALARAETASRAVEQMLLRSFEAIEGLQDLAEARQRLAALGHANAAAALEEQLIGTVRQARFGVRQVAVIDAQGMLAWSSLPGWQPVALADRAHFQVPREGERRPYISAPLVGRASGQVSVQVARRIEDSAGGFAGVVVVSLDPGPLAGALKELQLGEGRRIRVLRRDGVILAESGGGDTLGTALPPDDPLRRALAEAPSGHAEIATPEGMRLVGYQSLSAVPLVVELSLDAEAEMASLGFVGPSIAAAVAAVSLLLLAALALSLLWLERLRTQRALLRAESEREHALERLAHAQRMESLGRLAGGIAHDFNNVLQAALGGAKLIERRSTEAGIRRLAGMVIQAGERGASVTQRLLAYARRGQLRAEPVPLAPLLEGLREVLDHTLGASVEVRLAIAPGLPPAQADRGQLEAVLINLAVNARDAIRPLGRGSVVLGAVLEEVPPPPPGAECLAPGRYLRIDVTDTGTGMDAATLARATEPFFTTKPKEEGTGLGLAMAIGFAEQSGGALAIESSPGKGTRVRLWLPEAVPEELLPDGCDDTLPALPQGTRVLLVEDEAVVRTLLAEAMRDRGLSVTEAEGGEAALAQQAQAPFFDLVVSDLAMPGLDGLALIHRLRERQARLPALLLTGHLAEADPQALRQAAAEGPFLMLHKPVAPEQVIAGTAALLSSLLRQEG